MKIIGRCTNGKIEMHRAECRRTNFKLIATTKRCATAIQFEGQEKSENVNSLSQQ